MKKLLAISLLVLITVMLYISCKKTEITEKKPVTKFYRLVQVDKNGNKTYSKVLKINQ